MVTLRQEEGRENKEHGPGSSLTPSHRKTAERSLRRNCQQAGMIGAKRGSCRSTQKQCQRDRTRGSGTEVQRLDKSGFKKEWMGQERWLSA